MVRTWLAVALAACIASSVAADIINVPGDFPTIQIAVGFAGPGDEVIVAPGTYMESFTYPGTPDIMLRSSEGPEVTFFEGQIIFMAGPPTGVIDGFTFTGVGDSVMNFVQSVGSPIIRNCIFSGGPNNGAMSILSGSPVITGCLFIGNNGGGQAGAIRKQGPDPLTLSDCTFVGNQARDGGAISISSSPQGKSQAVTVIGCTFVGNTASGFGGAITSGQFTASVFVNCVFAENHAGLAGGSMFNSGASPVLVNCTFVGNTAGVGGGIFNANFSFPVVANSILWDNFPFQIYDSDSFTTMLFSDIDGGWNAPGVIGIIDADPMFLDPSAGDYRLQPGSPCIDAGHNWAITGLADTDLDGNPRFADGPAKDTGCGVPVIVDMGAYEFQGKPFAVKLGDIDGDGVVAVGDFLDVLAAWGPCVAECCLADLDLDGEVGVTDFLALLGNWG